MFQMIPTSSSSGGLSYEIRMNLIFCFFLMLFVLIISIGFTTSHDQYISSCRKNSLINKMNICQFPEKKNSLADGTSQFALDLYKLEAENTNGNMFLSPFSIELALVMTFAGAKRATAEEMKRTLKLSAFTHDSEIHDLFHDIMESLSILNEAGISLLTGNRMYVQQNFRVLKEFQQTLEEKYLSGVASVDFIKNAEKARHEINDWIEKQTQDKIKGLIKEGVLDPLTRLVLVNAIYFKGNWDKQFSPDSTSEAQFYVDDSTVVKVDMMYQKARFPYGISEELDCSILELPYVGRKLSMLFILPNEIEGLNGLQEKLNVDTLKLLIGSLHEREVHVSIPKFRIEGEISLKESLSKLGMSTIFTDKADFSGITGSNDLFVSAVLHKAFLEVNEEGSEAAAATAVVLQMRALILPPEFIANHPFLLLIRDNFSGVILFMGRVVNPSST